MGKQFIDLITFSKKDKEGYKFYKTKYFYGRAYPQFEGTPDLKESVPDDKYINSMDSNDWNNLGLGALQYYSDSYNAKVWLDYDLRGGKKSNAWKWFIREDKHITKLEKTYLNPYSLIELNSQRKALHSYMQTLMPKVYDKYINQ